jgi:ribosomal protein L37AE/L43A
MGQKLTYKCKKCGYSTMTSAGLDWGFLAVVETHICLNCKEVVDVLVGEQGKVFEKGKDKKAQFGSLKDFYTCPECRGTAIEKWDADIRPCPKCDGRLEKDESAGEMLWD